LQIFWGLSHASEKAAISSILDCSID
jgi:hypothetical protein